MEGGCMGWAEEVCVWGPETQWHVESNGLWPLGGQPSQVPGCNDSRTSKD
jgi:hypothetical protein